MPISLKYSMKQSLLKERHVSACRKTSRNELEPREARLPCLSGKPHQPHTYRNLPSQARQYVVASGQLLCNGAPYDSVRVRLMEEDFFGTIQIQTFAPLSKLAPNSNIFKFQTPTTSWASRTPTWRAASRCAATSSSGPTSSRTWRSTTRSRYTVAIESVWVPSGKFL